MYGEIIEAITNYYKDNEDIAADCLLYLKNHSNNHYMSDFINKTLNEMDRCIDCGTKLEICYYKEWHPEIGVFENLADIYCPHCDISHK